MKVITRVLGIMLSISASQISVAAEELGEICFSGSFQNTGICLISVEATKHGKYFSLNGLSQCNTTTGKEGLSEDYSGITHGSGYIDDEAVFNGAMEVISTENSDATPRNLIFWINLKTQKVVFKGTTEGREICNPFRNCDSSIEFELVTCP